MGEIRENSEGGQVQSAEFVSVSNCRVIREVTNVVSTDPSALALKECGLVLSTRWGDIEEEEHVEDASSPILSIDRVSLVSSKDGEDLDGFTPVLSKSQRRMKQQEKRATPSKVKRPRGRPKLFR